MNDQQHELTLEEAVAQAEMTAAKLRTQLAEKHAAERPNALAKVSALIRTYGITRAELQEIVRKRPKKARGPRKAKSVASEQTATPKAAP